MLTRYLSSVTVTFSPFLRTSKTARLFLSLLPSNARQSGVKIITNIVPVSPEVAKRVNNSKKKKLKEGGEVEGEVEGEGRGVVVEGKRVESWVGVVFKDGKEIKFETSKMGIKDLVEEMDRHSRLLARKDELAG